MMDPRPIQRKTLMRKLAILAALAAAVLTLAACGDTPPRQATSPTVPLDAQTENVVAVLEQVPLVVARDPAGRCDWGAKIVIDKTNELVEKHRDPTGLTEIAPHKNNATCNIVLTVRKVRPEPNLKVETGVIRGADLETQKGQPGIPQAYEQTRGECVSLAHSQGVKYSWRSAQRVRDNFGATQYAHDFTTYVSTKQVGGNGGMNCVVHDSTTYSLYRNESIYLGDGIFAPPAAPWAATYQSQAPSGPASPSASAWCTPGSCVATEYVGFFSRSWRYCWDGSSLYGEANVYKISDEAATVWPGKHYMWFSSNGSRGTAGWGYPFGYPASFNSCQDINGYRQSLEYALIAV
jgi:hypothetical protein